MDIRSTGITKHNFDFRKPNILEKVFSRAGGVER